MTPLRAGITFIGTREDGSYFDPLEEPQLPAKHRLLGPRFRRVSRYEQMFDAPEDVMESRRDDSSASTRLPTAASARA